MSFVDSCDLHIPYKNPVDSDQHAANMQAIERWAAYYRQNCGGGGGGGGAMIYGGGVLRGAPTRPAVNKVLLPAPGLLFPVPAEGAVCKLDSQAAVRLVSSLSQPADFAVRLSLGVEFQLVPEQGSPPYVSSFHAGVHVEDFQFPGGKAFVKTVPMHRSIVMSLPGGDYTFNVVVSVTMEKVENIGNYVSTVDLWNSSVHRSVVVGQPISVNT